MAQPNLIPKRISALPKMIDDEVTAELIDKTKSADWAMAIDSLRRSNSEDRPEGTTARKEGIDTNKAEEQREEVVGIVAAGVQTVGRTGAGAD